MSNPFYIRRTGNRAVYQVSYGSAHGPQMARPTVEFIIPSRGAPQGMLWRYSPSHTTPDRFVGQPCAPLNNAYPIWLSANPFNPAELLLLVDNVEVGVAENTFIRAGAQLYRAALPGGLNATDPALWLSQDDGATWTAVTVAQGAGGGGNGVRIRTVEWSRATSGNWLMCGFFGTELSLLYRGTYGLGDVAAFADNTTFTGEVPRAQYTAAGMEDDALIGGRDGLPAYSALGENRLTRLTANNVNIVRYLDSAPADRGLVGIKHDANRIVATPDYRGASPTERSSANLGTAYQTITWATHGVYTSGAAGPVVRVTNLFSPRNDGATVTAAQISGTTATSCSLIRADRQTRSGVGARLAGASGPLPDTAVTVDGETWTLVPGPTAAPVGTLSGLIEVLVRRG